MTSATLKRRLERLEVGAGEEELLGEHNWEHPEHWGMTLTDLLGRWGRDKRRIPTQPWIGS